MKKLKIPKGEVGWCFAIINGRLGEIYLKVDGGVNGIWSHCYIKREEFTKTEQKMIDKDIKKHRLVYRKGKYQQVKLVKKNHVMSRNLNKNEKPPPNGFGSPLGQLQKH
jgi:hypothetical protein